MKLQSKLEMLQWSASERPRYKQAYISKTVSRTIKATFALRL